MTSMDKRRNVTLGRGTRTTNVHVVLDQSTLRDIRVLAVFTNADKANAFAQEHLASDDRSNPVVERHRVR